MWLAVTVIWDTVQQNCEPRGGEVWLVDGLLEVCGCAMNHAGNKGEDVWLVEQ
jgi:hypothetical protein